MIEVELPNGGIAEFPDEMPHDEIAAVIQNNGVHPAVQQDQFVPEGPSYLEQLDAMTPLERYESGITDIGELYRKGMTDTSLPAAERLEMGRRFYGDSLDEEAGVNNLGRSIRRLPETLSLGLIDTGLTPLKTKMRNRLLKMREGTATEEDVRDYLLMERQLERSLPDRDPEEDVRQYDENYAAALADLEGSAIPNVRAGVQQAGLRAASMAARAADQLSPGTFQEYADDLNRKAGAIGAAADKVSENDIVPDILQRGARSAASSISTLVGAAPLGLPGIIATFAGQAGNEAITEGRDLGLDEDQIKRRAATKALIEGGITSAFSLLGAGGLEKIPQDMARSALREGFKPTLREMAKNFGHEVAEEELIEMSNLLADRAQIDRHLSPKEVMNVALETFVATGMTMGAMGSAQGAAGLAAPSVPDRRDELVAEQRGFAIPNPMQAPLRDEVSRDSAETEEQAASAVPDEPQAPLPDAEDVQPTEDVTEPSRGSLDKRPKTSSKKGEETVEVREGVLPQSAVEHFNETSQDAEDENLDPTGWKIIRPQKGTTQIYDPSTGRSVTFKGEGAYAKAEQYAVDNRIEPTTPKREFSSTQVEFPKEVADKVRSVSSKIPDEDLAEDGGREDQPHITVKYGLDVDEATAVQALLKDEPPIRVKLGKTSIFSADKNRQSDVVKVEVESEDLARLNKKVADAVPNKDTYPDYTPHVTLAYVKPGKGEKYAGDESLKGTEVTFDQVVFSGRDGQRIPIKLEGKEETPSDRLKRKGQAEPKPSKSDDLKRQSQQPSTPSKSDELKRQKREAAGVMPSVHRDVPEEGQSVGAAFLDTDEHMPTDEERETGRYEGRANPATTEAGRREVMWQDSMEGRVEHRPRSVAQDAADARLQAYPEGEKQRFLKQFSSATDPVQLNEEDTHVVKRLIDDISMGAAFRDHDAMADLQVLLRGYRQGGTEAARAFGARRDEIVGPAEKNARDLQDMMGLLTDEQLANLIEALKAAGLSDKSIQDIASDTELTLLVGNKIFERIPAGVADAFYEYWQNSILSGPLTQAANIIGNTTNAALEFGVNRMAESLLNMALQRNDGITFNDYRYLMRGVVRGARQGVLNAVLTYKYEQSAYARQFGIDAVQKIEDSGFAIKGRKGRWVRAMGYRPLLAADDFFKTVFAHMDVSVQARQIATEEGLTGEEMERRIDELADPRNVLSEAWRRADETAERLTFQQSGGEASKLVKGAANKIREIPGMRYIVPFVRTPFNIFTTAMEPVPIVGFAGPLLRYKFGDAVSLRRSIALQGMGVGVMALVWNAVGDEDEEPWITGSREQKTGRRDLQYRTHPPQSIRIGDKWYSYARVEPFATTMTTIVDATKELKKTGSVSASTGRAFSGAVSSMGDKTFMRNLGDVIKVVTNLDREDIRKVPANVITGFVPNAYRQPKRLADNRLKDTYIRKSDTLKTAVKKTLTSTELPFTPPPMYKRDLWGREINYHSSSTSLGWRLTVPVQVKDTKTEIPADAALAMWNEQNPDDEYAPQLPSPLWSDKSRMSPAEYDRFVRLAGEISLKKGSKIKFSDPPRKEQIDELRKIITTTRRQVKKQLEKELRR